MPADTPHTDRVRTERHGAVLAPGRAGHPARSSARTAASR